MNKKQHFQTLGYFCLIIFIPIFLCFTFAWAQETDLIRNGNFSNGLSEWIVNPETGASWNPINAGGVDLHPPSSGFNGTIIYQNLSVEGISSATINVQARLAAQWPQSSGNAIAFYLSYVDSSNTVSRVKILSPENNSIPQAPGALFSESYQFPAQARKLIKFEVAKENYGSFILSDIFLTTNADIKNGLLPFISGLSSNSGAYQSSLTITGNNFGIIQPTVLINGSDAGISVTSSSQTHIVVTVEDPATSGRVSVVTDYVESNINHVFKITSPHYATDVVNDEITAIKGQKVEFLIKIGFLNGFTTLNGVDFTVQGLPQGTLFSFSPVPVKNSGGSLLKIDTDSLAEGEYPFVIQASDGVAAIRSMDCFLEILTITDIRFYESVYDEVAMTTTKNYLTSKSVMTQGQIAFGVDAVDTRGNIWTSINSSLFAFKSSNPGVVGVYDRSFGPEFYALQSGDSSITAITADGYQESLGLTISVSSPSVKSVSLLPQTVANTSTEDITFQAQADGTLGWIGYDSSGMMEFNTDFLEKIIRSPGNLAANATFRLVDLPTDLGTVLFSATTGSNKRIIPIHLVSDPLLSELRGGVRPLEDAFSEIFELEFYDPSNDLKPLFKRQLFLMHGDNNFDIGGIPPGTYKLRFLTEGDTLKPQWYPNADLFSNALPVSFVPGLVSDIYFFNQGYPVISFKSSVKNGEINYPANGIDNATVQIVENSNVWLQTDAQGDFQLFGIRSGQSFDLVITKQGFIPVYSQIFNLAEDMQTLLPYGFFQEGTLQTWGNTPGTGLIFGRVSQLSCPAGYQSGATVTAVNADNNDQAFPVTYMNSSGDFGGSTTDENGIYAVFNVPDGVTVKLTVLKSGWGFISPEILVKSRANSMGQASFLGSSVDEPVIRSRFEAAMTAYDNGNLAEIMTFISIDFLDDGMNRLQFEAKISQMIQAGELMTYAIQSVVVNEDTATMKVTWNGQESDILQFRKEGGFWQLYGNQQKYKVSAFSGHSQTANWVEMMVEDPGRTITAVSVSGPGIDDSIQLTYNQSRQRWVSWTSDFPYSNIGPEFGNSPPNHPLTYQFVITDSQESVITSATVNHFVNTFAAPVYPAENQVVSENFVFSWTGVGSGYSYGIELNDSKGMRLWDVYGVAGSSVSCTEEPLTPGSYSYNLQVRDIDENFSMITVPFLVKPPKGDLDQNGKVNLNDAMSALKVHVGIEQNGITSDAEVNGDGKAGIEEVLYDLQFESKARDH